jgi:hypothetical protein
VIGILWTKFSRPLDTLDDRDFQVSPDQPTRKTNKQAFADLGFTFVSGRLVLVFAHNLDTSLIQDIGGYCPEESCETSLIYWRRSASKVCIYKVYMQAVYACKIVVASMASELPCLLEETSPPEKVLKLGLMPERMECPPFACKSRFVCPLGRVFLGGSSSLLL